MKKVKIISIFLIIQSFHFSIRGNNNTYFSYNIPAGWDSIPFSTIKLAEEKAKKLADNKSDFQTYDGGLFLEKNNGNPFEFPYILYKFRPIANLNQKSFNEITQIIKSQLKDVNLSVEYNNFKQFFSNMKGDVLFVDSLKHIVFCNIEMEYKGVGKINTIWANFIGAQGMLWVYCYSRNEEYEFYLSQFNEVINSISLKEKYSYSPQNASSNEKYENYKKLLYWLLGAMVIYYLRVLYKKSKNQS